MKSLFLLAAVFAASTVQAKPSPSLHPRVGQLAQIDFPTGSSRLLTAVSDELGEVAAWAKENPDGLVVLNGHARSGEAPNLVTLSLERARAVRDQLVTLGVDPDMIVIAAFGADGPEHADNRRVAVWGTHQDVQANRGPLRQARTVIASPMRPTRSATRPRGRR